MISGSVLTAFYWTHAIAPAQIRATNVLVAAAMGVNFSSNYHFLQLHRNNPSANQVPLFSIPFPPNGTVVMDLSHLGNGIASDGMWIALSLSQTAYQAVSAPNGSVQLMIR